jgi:hypothetical protein
MTEWLMNNELDRPRKEMVVAWRRNKDDQEEKLSSLPVPSQGLNLAPPEFKARVLLTGHQLLLS